ncbi:MAG: excinuclease ABC subunit C [Pseudomonas fluorescens]|nr:MAG: excinuclease ABC subunit C [Pseudomonas fluorescens]
MKLYGVYMVCSRAREGAIYTGMSGNIPKRVRQNGGFEDGGAAWALRYKARHLVYYEILDDYEKARLREEQLKGWKREWKVALIEKLNPAWSDLRAKLERDLAGA